MVEPKLTPKLLLQAYASGIFPMAESQDDPEVFWVDPSRRGILPLDRFHISRSLRRVILSGRFQPRFDSDFAGTVAGCAERAETWINATIFELYLALYRMGRAHSQEIWEDGELVGGVYGVA
ncbi:MAG: leucyl/phenylalanyl-tRNA--protein transferase, partial [Paracoccaceae bacterium]